MGIKCQISEEKSGKVHVKKQLTPVFLMHTEQYLARAVAQWKAKRVDFNHWSVGTKLGVATVV